MKTKVECVEGIILSDVNYSETSKILNILTKEHGMIGVMSKGCRSMKSKLRAVSRKLIYAKFHIYYKTDGLCTLIAVDIINSYNNILNSLDNISYASYILELTYQVVKQNDDKEIFQILRASLDKINDDINPRIITDIVQLKYLDYLGVKPNIDGCSICGSEKNIVTLNSDVGGFICKDCYTKEFIVKDITIKLIRMFYYVNIDKIEKVDVKNENLKEIDFFLDDYYERYTGLFLKSKKMIEKIRNLVEC